MSSKKKSTAPSHDRKGSRDNNESYLHLTKDPLMFARAELSAKKYLVAHFHVPIQVIDGTLMEMSAEEYENYLLEEIPSIEVPIVPATPDDVELSIAVQLAAEEIVPADDSAEAIQEAEEARDQFL